MRLHLKSIFIIISLFFTCSITSQNKRFFDYNQGLSNSLINDIHQDHLGFIWIATEDGLNRFDGIKFTTFTKESNNLKANYITKVKEDTKGNLWVGLFNGLLKYNHLNQSFSEVKIYIDDQQIHPFITDIIISETQDIWIATSGYGLIRIPTQLGRPRYSTRFNNRFPSLLMRSLFEDSEGILWIGTDNDGLVYFNPKTDENGTVVDKYSGKVLKHDITSICEGEDGNIYAGSLKNGLLKIDKQNLTVQYLDKASDIAVKTVYRDSKNQLWVASDGMGLYHLNYKNNKLVPYSPPSSPFDFSKSKVHSILEDNNGNIWTAIFQKGLFLFPESQNIFSNYGYKAFGENSIGSNCISAITGDKNNIWIGTDGDGVYHYDLTKEKVTNILLRNKGKLEGNNIFSFKDAAKYLWIGTYSSGLIRLNKETKQTKYFKHDTNNPKSIPADIITVIKDGNNEDFWLATFGAGVINFNPKNETFTNKLPVSDSLNNIIPKWVNDVHLDNKGRFWVGTYDGLVLVEPKTDKATFFNVDNENIPNNVVYCIKEDYKGNIWTGTYGGLVKINPNTLDCKTYTTNDGLASNVICAIEEDEYFQLWMSTHKGLSRLDTGKEAFVNYYASDGLQSNEFSRNAVYKTAINELFFGGINGITEIKKDYNTYKNKAPNVILTDFNKNNKAVNIGDKSGKYKILSESIILEDTIHLNEKDNIFSIEFTSENLAGQSSISYEYMMEGFDKVWNQSDAQSRKASYTNLPHNTYIFKVRSINKDAYSEPRALTIIIHPPWYKTTWAKLLWFVITATLLWLIIGLYKDKFRHIEIEKLNDKKMQFFINVSHEIRTPLSLIIDPLDKLLAQKSNAETMRLYSIMQQNSNRILRLINQLLDVRKLDKSQMLTKFQKTELKTYIENITSSYNYLATSKNIKLLVLNDSENIEVWIDPLNFEKVIINLLSNAFKFTPNDGKISLTISQFKANERSFAKISILDNGIGINKSQHEKIFERFYQVDSKETRNNAGTGIGLHLSRSLVELHKGRLYMQNGENNIGSEFIIEIPLGNAHLPKKDLLIDENIIPAPIHQHKPSELVDDSTSDTKAKTNYKLMIVEDELEIRNYLINEFSERYTVIAYENGKQAHINILNDKPDIIISDIMMPEMDGISFCKKVKNNIDTSHIPIILLTALTKEEDKAEGIETGADMYLSKPFNTSFLKKSLTNLLENRRRIATKIEKKAEQYTVEAPNIKTHDEILMQKIMTIIKDNISNSELNVEMLADSVGISRVHLHRKLKELTNQSARDLIRNIRMKQASYILTNKKMNVSEVAYAIGFSSLSHFSSSFKAYYGVSPKEYVALQNKQSNNLDSLDFTND
ncbi:hybrid sensor histidine kinase/response regulator [Saccharicrinis aurantiacus]|uniref:hybrid sensor histidine kinase/response regulator n=1 Tax=Saccharicrinis aurantiacus TaxID=1849719 RepID=UPI00094FE6E8|nr:two-component regulator propeller domain-containing protein [Saccharicrinis aurantiacus]